ncbi:UDP-N-acetylglucosamine transferase subunit alg13 [Apiospora phragmitis]|uniref:UDP-N-acetylglucosamine transferase subunit ALG13 n=1 Tax=Apiospora phragmitis TaxID=2905665 RepID=A0ABR1TS25_9PEZI
MAYQNESPEGDWILVMPKENEDSYSKTSNFFADAVANPGHELGPYIKSSAERDSIYYHQSNIVTMAPADEDQIPGKTCFVTVGATASFRSLIDEVVSPEVVAALAAQGFDSIIVQCGPDFEHFEAIRPSDPAVLMSGFSVESNIMEYMRECAPSDGPRKRHTGLIITHAGAGTIMDALKVNTRVIAVPNTDLMGNHQMEMAEEFAKKGWLIHGELGKIHEAIKQSATFMPAAYPPKPPRGSENRGLEQITQDVVNGTWRGGSGSTLSEYLRGPLRYFWDVMTADDLGPDYDDQPHEGPAGNSDQESDEDADSDAEKTYSPKPKLKRVLFDNGDGTSTVTHVPVPENESPGFFGRLFGRTNHDDGRANQADDGANQDDGLVDEHEQRQRDVFDSLFGDLGQDDGFQETDPEVLRRTRYWQEVDDRFDSMTRLYVG